MCKKTGTYKDMENMLALLSGHLETLDHVEVIYSRKRGYLVLRWDIPSETYYGIDSIKDADQLAMYIYGELIDQITEETGSDHNLKCMDLDEPELEKARAVTEEFISVLPEETKERLCKKMDPKTGLLRYSGGSVKSLLG